MRCAIRLCVCVCASSESSIALALLWVLSNKIIKKDQKIDVDIKVMQQVFHSGQAKILCKFLALEKLQYKFERRILQQ